jgi:hypothetical protein
MKKNVSYFLLALLCLFAFSGVVFADEQANEKGKTIDELPNMKCGATVKSKGLSLASEVKVSFETVEYTTPKDPNTVYYYVDINILNVQPGVYVEVQNGKTGGTFEVDSTKANSEGIIKLRQKDTSDIVNYTFYVKAQTLECYGQTLRTIRLSVPKYNNLSQRAICAEVPEYYMCQTFTSVNIDSSKFLKSVTEYKESLENKETAKVEKGELGIVAGTKKVVSKNKFVIIGLVLIAGAIATVVVIKKKRSVL